MEYKVNGRLFYRVIYNIRKIVYYKNSLNNNIKKINFYDRIYIYDDYILFNII